MKCALCTGNLSWGGLPRNSEARTTDRPDMTLAVDHRQKNKIIIQIIKL